MRVYSSTALFTVWLASGLGLFTVLGGVGRAEGDAEAPAADPAYLPTKLGVDELVPLGWSHGLMLQGGANMDSQTNVVGKENGFSSTFGLKLDGFILDRFVLSEWKNTLNIAEATQRTKALSVYNSSRDELRFESLYVDFFRAVPWTGTFARGAVETSLFDSYDVEPAVKTYAVKNADGTSTNVASDRFHLSHPFRPLTKKESLGLLARPVEHEELNLELRSGIGARQVTANGQRVLGKEKDGVIPVTELRDNSEIGLEALANLSGQLDHRRYGYRLFAEALRPYFHTPQSDGRGKNPSQLTSTDVGGSLSLNWTSWSALVYEFRAKRDPLLSDQAQLSQSLMATVSFATHTPGADALQPKAPAH